ncbi:MAG: helix-turn-helix transcriptional regulator [Nitrospiraceae bacterium]
MESASIGLWIWRPSTRFNGATAIEPWNRVTVDGVVRTNLTLHGPRQLSRGITQEQLAERLGVTRLQWGHGN